MAQSSVAHHSYAAYDLLQTHTLKGTVETFHWSNPHSEFTLVLEADGRSEPIRWNIITGSPAVLKRFGWTQHSLKSGDRVSVLCNPMTDGSHAGRLHTVVLLDTGQVLRTKFSADASSSAGPFAYPYVRPASASQARGPDSPFGLRPLLHPAASWNAREGLSTSLIALIPNPLDNPVHNWFLVTQTSLATKRLPCAA